VSAAKRAFVAPGAPGTPVTTSGDRQMTVKFTAPTATNGATASELRYQYSVNGGAWTGQWTGTSHVVTGLTNGAYYTVRVRAYTALDGASYTGAASGASNRAVPYGKPGSPAVTATASGTSITYHWSPPAVNGRRITAAQVQIDGTQVSTATSGTITKSGYGYSTTHTVKVRVKDTAGQWSGWVSKSAKTVAKPTPSATPGKGASGTWSNPPCTTSSCAYGKVTYKNLPKGDYKIYCNGTGAYGGTWGGATYKGLSGSGTKQLSCYFGGKGDQFWVTMVGPVTVTSSKMTWY
jgi:hypothetical protein